MEFLLRLVRAVKGEASSARHELDVGAEHAFYREIRTTQQEITPAQNDGFMAAFMLRILRRAAGRSWDAKEVWLKVCDPRAIPSGYLDIKVVGGDRMGMVVRFPSQWLLQPLDQRALIDTSLKLDELAHTPTEFLDSLRQTVTLHLDKRDLNVDFVARLAGISRQALQRRLKANGTTFSAELVELKKRRAAEDLTSSVRPISEIAMSLGFSDPTSFTRAFKSWTGQSPRDYRKNSGSR
jgi:AraC-like DNA-binding protein